MALLIPLVIVQASCTPHFVLDRFRQELKQAGADRRNLSPLNGLHDFHVAIHVHTHLSHDSDGTVAEIARAAKRAGVDAVITTDHSGERIFTEGFEGKYESVLFIRGMEVIKGCVGWSGAGCSSLLLIGLRNYFDHRPLSYREVLEEAKRQGALTIVAHAPSFNNRKASPSGEDHWLLPGLDGLEIYDILDDAVDHRWRLPKYFFDVLYSYRSYREEVFLSILDPPTETAQKWDGLTGSTGRRWVAVAGNDAHENVRVLGRLIDPYELSFGFVKTHILSEILTEESVMTALRAGHAYVAFDLLADATGFRFVATEEDRLLALMGDELPWSEGVRLKAETPVACRLTLFRNGQAIQTIEGTRLEAAPTQPGVYRIEASLNLRGRRLPWIYSNPIYLR
jgi:hypothetical protein